MTPCTLLLLRLSAPVLFDHHSLYIPQAWYKTIGGQGAFRTTIYLPPGASQTARVQGDYQHNSKSAKNAAALKAIHQLYNERKMTGYLFPSWRSNYHAQQLGEYSKAQQLEREYHPLSTSEPWAPEGVCNHLCMPVREYKTLSLSNPVPLDAPCLVQDVLVTLHSQHMLPC